MESWIHFQEVLACLHISAHMRCFYNRSLCYPKQDHGGKDTYYQACELMQEVVWIEVGQFNNSSSRASDSKQKVMHACSTKQFVLQINLSLLVHISSWVLWVNIPASVFITN